MAKDSADRAAWSRRERAAFQNAMHHPRAERSSARPAKISAVTIAELVWIVAGLASAL